MRSHFFRRRSKIGHFPALRREIENIRISDYKRSICWALFAFALLIAGCGGVTSENGQAAGTANVLAPSLSFQPNKSVTWGNNPNGAPWYWKALSDSFDAVNMGGYLHACLLNNNCMPQAYLSSPYFVGLFSADTDYFIGVSCGPDFDCGGTPYGGSKNDSDLGRIVLATSPLQTYDQGPTRVYSG